MDPVQDATAAAGSCPVQSQAPVRTWRASSKRGASAAKTLANTASRFHGDGVHYKAKLIGVDSVPGAQGDKMCLDTMMKLKGLEAASRSHGKHKQRVWLKVSSSGLKIVDERTGVVEHDHDCNRISSLTKDESDPRALAYIYQHQDTFTLFYIKMASLADPVLNDIKEVCQRLDRETPEEPPDKPTPVKYHLHSQCLCLSRPSFFIAFPPVSCCVFSRPVPYCSWMRVQHVCQRTQLNWICSVHSQISLLDKQNRLHPQRN
ncbi:disabled homolog 2-like [Polymixia lowei]